jgi:F-type H+-transporting ATPase subunit a
MQAHYTYLGEIIKDHDAQEFITAIFVAAIILAVGYMLTGSLRRASAVDGTEAKKRVVPSRKLSLFGLVDLIIESFVGYQDQIMGKENRRYASFTGAVFMFILFTNLLGLVPGMAAATTTVWVNVGMAISVFIYFNYLGVREHGLFNYLKHFWGPVFVMGFILFPVEIISVVLRVLTLNLRLYWNIEADHAVLGIFTDLAGFFAFPMYTLGVFVSFMQALIFTTLTMVYILLAVSHEEEH